MAGIDISKLQNAHFDDEKVEKKKVIYVSSKEEMDAILKPQENKLDDIMKKGEEANKKFQAALNSGDHEAADYWLSKVRESTDAAADILSIILKMNFKLRR